MITFQSTLISKQQLAQTVYLLQFSTDQAPDFSFQAGQYIIAHIPQPSGTPLRRLYSIASPPSQKKSIELLIEAVPNGIGSTHITNLQEDDTITLQGPAGLFTIKDPNKQSIFLATGTGIAPMRSILKQLLSSQQKSPQTSSPKYQLFWGLKYYADVYLFEELQQMAEEHPSFSFTICLSREKHLDMIEYIPRTFFCTGRMNPPIDNAYHYYICGSRHVVEDVKNDIFEKGVPKEQVHFEKF